MSRSSSLILWWPQAIVSLAILAMLSFAPQAARAQEPDAAAEDNPFAAPADEMPADEMPDEEEPAADDDEGSPFGSADADADDANADSDAGADAEPAVAEAAGPKIPDDPAVQAVLESKPQTPFELLRAIRILADLGHPQLAEPFVKQLTGQQLDVHQQAALFKQFPSGVLMRLARDPEIGKSLAPFIDGLYRAADAVRRDPVRLAQWVKHLSDPSEAVRAQATHALLQAGSASVAPLLAVVADPARVSEHRLAKRVLVQLGPEAVPALIGALESPNEAIKIQVVEVLGAMRAEAAVASLLGPMLSPHSSPVLRAMSAAAIQRISGHVPSQGEAMNLLEYAAHRRLNESRLVDNGTERVVEIWQWDAAKNESVPVNYDAAGAKLAEALRLAADLRSIDKENPYRRRLYLVTLLEAAKLANGLDKPLPTDPGTPYAVAAEFGPHAIEDVLAYALAENYIPAAIAAAQILGDIGSLDLLAHGGATPSTLARAAQHIDRRLRFAAIAAIMKLNPQQPFAGSSAVTEGLGFFAGSYGVPRILIAHPLSAEGGKIAGLAAALGYEADVATTGRQAFEQAVASPDYELVLIHSAINRPAVDELLAQFKRDRRTAALPVGLMAPFDDFDRIKDFARRAGSLPVFLEPQNEGTMKLDVSEVLARAGRSHVSVEERQAQATAAMDWLVALAQRPGQVFDLHQLEKTITPLIYVPAMAGKAIELLGDIGTEASQRALVQLADSPAQPLATRRAAVTALARSIRKYGTLLTTGEIYAQYDLYNYNAGRNKETHQVLGALLDVIEHRGDPPPPEDTRTSAK